MLLRALKVRNGVVVFSFGKRKHKLLFLSISFNREGAALDQAGEQ